MRVSVCLLALLSAQALAWNVPSEEMDMWRSRVALKAEMGAESCEQVCDGAKRWARELNLIRSSFCRQFSSVGATRQCSHGLSMPLVVEACKAGCAQREACDLDGDQRARDEQDMLRKLWLAGQGRKPPTKRFFPIHHGQGREYALVADLLEFVVAKDSTVHTLIDTTCASMGKTGPNSKRKAEVQACGAARDLAVAMGCNTSVAMHEATEAAVEVQDDGSFEFLPEATPAPTPALDAVEEPQAQPPPAALRSARDDAQASDASDADVVDPEHDET